MKRMFNLSIDSDRISNDGINSGNANMKQNHNHTVYSVCLMDYGHGFCFL